MEELRDYPANRARVLRNRTCVYCGCDLTPETRTKEHVIGRKFVPHGKLNAAWNLIAYACESCNNKKADLEDDIGAITLLASTIGDAPRHDDLENAAAKSRKSISRRTGKRVSESLETNSIAAQMMPGMSVNVSFIAPPQVDQDRLFELARYHMTAFFYLTSYDEEHGVGYFVNEGIHPFMHANWSDWGNMVLRAYGSTVLTWNLRFLVATADGFFRACLRQHPNGDCWSWALEWNKNARLVGFAGNRTIAQSVVDSLPDLPKFWMRQPDNTLVSYRREVALEEGEDDLLFADGNGGQSP